MASPHLLDIRTMVLIYVGVRAGLAVVLAYLWSVQRNYPPARDWAIGALLTSAGLFFLALRHQVPHVVSELVANGFLLPGWMVFDFGIVRAVGKQPPFKLGLLLCAIALGTLVLFGFVLQNYPLRILLHHAVLLGFDLIAVYACLTDTSSRRQTFRVIAFLLMVSVATFLWRIADDVFGLMGPVPPVESRLLLVGVSLVVFPMICMLLALQTSQKLQEELNVQARHDMLTGAYNRRAFSEFIEREWGRALRHDCALSVISVDIDNFKVFNDRYGHQTGDEALVLVSQLAQSALRSGDIWCRHGGEEFVALLPDTRVEQAFAIAERLRLTVEQACIPSPQGWLNVSISIGVAERTAQHGSWKEVMAVSDAALYQAKAAGKNVVIAAVA